MSEELNRELSSHDIWLERIAALERDLWRAETEHEARSIERAIQRLSGERNR